MSKIREWISVYTAKSPKLVVILGILIANVFFISIAALIIMWLAPPSMENTDYWHCVYYAVTMLLTGYLEIVVQDIGEIGALLVMFCVVTAILGMIVFTGAVIGYMTEFISSFIEDAGSGSRKLHISNHIVILNWNSRAAEIVNEFLYKNTKEKIVILVESDREEVLNDINERLSATLEDEKEAVRKNKLTIIVREGDSWSTKQLNDISIKKAKSVIILNKEDVLTIKTLLQVVQMTAEEDSADNQQVIVEVENDWTFELIETIIGRTKLKGKRNIVPVAVNHILGQIFPQISIMPELNLVFNDLFSHKGATFHSQSAVDHSTSEDEFISGYFDNHLESIPLSVTCYGTGKPMFYYLSNSAVHKRSTKTVSQGNDLKVSINSDFEIKDKHVIILGHNSKNQAIMEGFAAFSNEWKQKDGPEVLDVTVIDNEDYLEEHDHYKQYPFVKKVIATDISEKDLICDIIEGFIGAHNGHRCILILSDEDVSDEQIDADALTYLILVQEVINTRLINHPDFDPNTIDMVVEILNPKNYDIVSNYSTENIVISNRYISKLIAQIGEKEALFDLYYDILTYDDAEDEETDSKELYTKKVSEYFKEIPGPCTAADLIRAVYHASPSENKTIVLGYVQSGGKFILFEGDQSKINVNLSGEDKLVVFSNH
ncbi:MAG: hypothetical protein FWD56_00250 [Bacteroidales bacterium]|nr:hypothetical protein [Bacteroidales bacterium]